ncbi:NUDIX hydrolase [Catellatospora paridis]|uniref:NUDIX hydrolase n=1 Tax=Catellatospora paridis TaxID=1617086 RepID=UPI0012D4807A|nr:NUDIX domain-containing protein [Catellatospora paridis]
MKRVSKVVAYIVRDGRLVVFAHGDHDTLALAGIQVPAGTVRPGELPEDAVLREAYEETELPGLRLVRYLGVGEYDTRPSADAVHVRHFYELAVDADEVPERWTTYETGDGSHDPIRFDLYWMPLAQAHVLVGGQGSHLGRLFD